MSSLKTRISHFAGRRVPVLSLILVALAGAIVGVLASGLITVASTALSGEGGAFHNDSGKFTIVDNGLAVAANTLKDSAASALACGGTPLNVYSNVTAGQWMDVLTFTTSASHSHVVRITARSDSASALGGMLTSVTTGTWTCTELTVVTVYVGLLTTSITPPLTMYESVT